MKREIPGPGQESVWDYPRPPRIEPVEKLIEIVFAGEVIASTQSSFRVLETSHPPVYYLPKACFKAGVLTPAAGQSFCEWKGIANYFDISVADSVAKRVAWGYPDPTTRFQALSDCVAVYAHAMDECRVAGEVVTPQPGQFYGGWITTDVVGPFKGSPGTMGW